MKDPIALLLKEIACGSLGAIVLNWWLESWVSRVLGRKAHTRATSWTQQMWLGVKLFKHSLCCNLSCLWPCARTQEGSKCLPIPLHALLPIGIFFTTLTRSAHKSRSTTLCHCAQQQKTVVMYRFVWRCQCLHLLWQNNTTAECNHLCPVILISKCTFYNVHWEYGVLQPCDAVLVSGQTSYLTQVS